MARAPAEGPAPRRPLPRPAGSQRNRGSGRNDTPGAEGWPCAKRWSRLPEARGVRRSPCPFPWCGPGMAGQSFPAGSGWRAMGLIRPVGGPGPRIGSGDWSGSKGMRQRHDPVRSGRGVVGCDQGLRSRAALMGAMDGHRRRSLAMHEVEGGAQSLAPERVLRVVACGTRTCASHFFASATRRCKRCSVAARSPALSIPTSCTRRERTLGSLAIVSGAPPNARRNLAGLTAAKNLHMGFDLRRCLWMDRGGMCHRAFPQPSAIARRKVRLRSNANCDRFDIVRAM
jgi:hypothetical protein